MSEEWYSRKPQNLFSREHRRQLPAGARMIDIDGLIYAPYIKGSLGGPVMLIEQKPEHAREDFWLVTRQLARMANIPAARIVTKANGHYRVEVSNGTVTRLIGDDLTIVDWYERVERPLRQRLGHRQAA